MLGALNVPVEPVVKREPAFVASGVDDVPAFPLEAALIGLAAATGVGALAGLLPALVAVRVKVIDAIRYWWSGVASSPSSTSASPTASLQTISPSRTAAALTLGSRFSA